MKIEGSVGIVFGGARGIGKGYAVALLDNKIKAVYICDILEDVGQETVKEFREKFGEESAYFIKVDATKHEEITAAFKDLKEKQGRLDIAVNNVGFVHETQWDKQVDLNLGTTIRISLAAMEVMGKDKGGDGGALIHTASDAGLTPTFFTPVYSATKAAMIMYVRSLSLPTNFEQHGIRMMCMCPSFVDTDFVKDSLVPGRIRNLPLLLEGLKNHPRGLLQVEWVSDVMITMIEDDTLNGVAAQMLTKEPTFFYKSQDDPSS